jgi:hypothetical protein
VLTRLIAQLFRLGRERNPLSSALLEELVAATDTLSESNILRSATPLAVDDALGLAPLLPDVEVTPNLAVAAFDEVQAVRIAVNC